MLKPGLRRQLLSTLLSDHDLHMPIHDCLEIIAVTQGICPDIIGILLKASGAILLHRWEQLCQRLNWIHGGCSSHFNWGNLVPNPVTRYFSPKSRVKCFDSSPHMEKGKVHYGIYTPMATMALPRHLSVEWHTEEEGYLVLGERTVKIRRKS